ncbi:MAG: flagellar basal body P-ring formation protein FlgA [Proteobacteria bacterium]|nr:flagellar basal body P-ring formation protein FlgA [Pseudomonadota bacterium]
MLTSFTALITALCAATLSVAEPPAPESTASESPVSERPVNENLAPVEASSSATGTQALTATLEQWMRERTQQAQGFASEYTFALNDKRLAVPACDAFVIDPKGLVQWHVVPSTLTIVVACPEQNWQRRVRGKRTVAANERQANEVQRPRVLVLKPLNAIQKGEPVSKDDLIQEYALVHRTPQNAVTTVKGAQRYAARNLSPGRILVQSDLTVGQPVVVLADAVPAGTAVTRASIKIEERAVDVPHDAIRSLQGLTLLAANRLLHPGDILRKRDLTKAKLIRRGQKVAVESVGRHFRIASELIALEDGYLGEQIDLRNPGSSRNVSAVVTGMGTARSGQGR